MKYLAWFFVAFFLSVSIGQAQTVCPPKVKQTDFQGQRLIIDQGPIPTLATKTKGLSSAAAVQIRNGRSCGSGSVVGVEDGNSYILTNAHVAGTRIGHQVQVRFQSNLVKNARVIMAAYSSRTQTDWAILKVEGFDQVRPVHLATERPTGTHYTRGSPKCVWPLRDTSITTADIADDSPLWRWRPNSIGGQSGSGIWSASNDDQYGLLTWSWGGLGAGQHTSYIYKQYTERNTDGPARIDGMIEVGIPAQRQEGFFAQTSIVDLPIWHLQDHGEPDPPPVVDDEEERERRLFKRLRARAKERGINWIKLIELIMKLIELFGEMDTEPT